MDKSKLIEATMRLYKYGFLNEFDKDATLRLIRRRAEGLENEEGS